MRNEEQTQQMLFLTPISGNNILSVRSTQNKLDEVPKLISHDSDNPRCNLLCFTETWRHKRILINLKIEGYTTIVLTGTGKRQTKAL